jgi:hypothetical protein
MDGELLQEKVYVGYAKAAERVGLSFGIYRSSDGIDPLNIANYLYDLPVSATQNWKYNAPNKFSGSTWLLVVDGLQVEVSDYLVRNGVVYYVAGKQHLLPILGVRCDRKITVEVAEIPIEGTKGRVGYSAMNVPPENKRIIVQDCPCSFIIGSKGEQSKVDIPTDTKMPWYAVYIPYFVDKHIPEGAFIRDEFDQEYQVSGNQRSDIGWKLTAHVLGA